MNPTRGVLDQCQKWLPPSTVKLVALGNRHLCQDSPRVDHRQEVVVIFRIESPEINHLFAMGVDHCEILTLLD